MRMPRLGIRHRVFAACLIVSVTAVAAIAGFGLRFLHILRARSRANCLSLAEMFAGQTRQRLIELTGEAARLAERLSHHQGELASERADTGTVVCSWAVYGGDGQRLAGAASRRYQESLAQASIGTPRLVVRERGRLADGLAGRPSAVLVPEGRRVYVLVYRAVSGPGGAPAVLQAAAVAADGDFTGGAEGDIRAVLRPFVASTDEPQVLTVDGQPRMVVHRPVSLGGRQLGTVTAAVPYDAEVRCAQGVMAMTLIVSAVALLALGILSYRLTGVAMVPLDEIRHYVSNHKAGQEVEQLAVGADDTIGAILEGYQEMINRSQVFADRLMASNRALRELLTGSVTALVNVIEANDGYTAGHSQRVAEGACALARELGWDYADVEQLRLGALLHDIGKLGISGEILNKPASLDDDEWALIHRHPDIGARILSAIPGCDDVVTVVRRHHERFDGSGYPDGLCGEEIPAGARIVAVADMYDALTSRRSYRGAFSPEEAIVILEQNAGGTLDPHFAAAFIEMLRRGAEPEGQARDPSPTAARVAGGGREPVERQADPADAPLTATAKESG